MFKLFKEGILHLRNESLEISKKIVDMQYELQPEFKKYGAAGYQKSLEDAKSNLFYLLDSVSFDSYPLFEDYIAWIKILFEQHHLPLKTMENFLMCTQKYFAGYDFEGKGLNSEIKIKIDEFIEKAYKKLDESNEIVEAKVSNPLIYIYTDYKKYILEGNTFLASKTVIEAIKKGIEIKDIYKWILEPFQKEVGELWQTNKITVAQEHFSTAVTQLVMSQMYEYLFNGNKNDKIMVGTCIGGELHELGIRMVTDYFEAKGWNTYYLGANMPEDSIIKTITEKNADIIAISTTMTFNVYRVSHLIEKIRAKQLKTKIMVGGYPFNIEPELWKRVGADGFSRNFEEAYEMGEKLTEG